MKNNFPISEDKARNVYNALTLPVNQGGRFGYAKEKVQASFLRQELPLRNNQSTYAFDFQPKNGSKPTERLLQRTDNFHMLGLGLLLAVENKNKPGSAPLLAYPQLFEVQKLIASGTAIGGIADPDVRDLNAIYNGILAIKQVSTEVVSDVDTRRFYVVPSTQENGINDRSEANYADGIISIEPQPILVGKDSNALTVTIPTWPGIALQSNRADWEINLVAYAVGYRILGVN